MVKRTSKDLPSKSAIAKAWAAIFDENGSVPWRDGFWDYEEPECWACRRYADSWTTWEKTSLQRCHVMPSANGGRDNPTNLVLMCRRCHEDSPDTDLPDLIFEWMRLKPKMILGRITPNEWQRTSELCQTAVSKNPGFSPTLDMVSLAFAAVCEQHNPGQHFGIGFSEGTRLALVASTVDVLVAEHQSSRDTA
jgi:hypothetical protein